jgi:hypothetical protein
MKKCFPTAESQSSQRKPAANFFVFNLCACSASSASLRSTPPKEFLLTAESQSSRRKPEADFFVFTLCSCSVSSASLRSMPPKEFLSSLLKLETGREAGRRRGAGHLDQQCQTSRQARKFASPVSPATLVSPSWTCKTTEVSSLPPAGSVAAVLFAMACSTC